MTCLCFLKTSRHWWCRLLLLQLLLVQLLLLLLLPSPAMHTVCLCLFKQRWYLTVLFLLPTLIDPLFATTAADFRFGEGNVS